MIKKFMRTIIIAVIILAILGFLGYTYSADVSALDNARVTIKDIRIQEIGLTSCELKIYIDISNPSNQDISGLSADFDVFITDTNVGSGSVSRVSIPAQSTKEKGVSLTIVYIDVAEAVIDVIIKGNFDLSIDGYASGDVLFGLIRVTDQISATKSYP
jgi:hypothetical protein